MTSRTQTFTSQRTAPPPMLKAWGPQEFRAAPDWSRSMWEVLPRQYVTVLSGADLKEAGLIPSASTIPQSLTADDDTFASWSRPEQAPSK